MSRRFAILRMRASRCRPPVADSLRLRLFPCAAAFAHEVRPAYLELREDAPGIFDVLFKTPMQGDARLALDVGFSGRVRTSDAGHFADNGQRHGADMAPSGD